MAGGRKVRQRVVCIREEAGRAKSFSFRHPCTSISEMPTKNGGGTVKAALRFAAGR